MKLDRKFRPFSKYQLIQKFKNLARPKDQANLVADAEADMAKQEEFMADRQQAQKPEEPKFPEDK